MKIIEHSFLRVGEKVPRRFVRQWVDAMGLEAFCRFWEKIRFSSYNQEVLKPVRFIGSAVRSACEGGWRWAVRKDCQNPPLNPRFRWMQGIPPELFEEPDPTQLDYCLANAKTFAARARLDEQKTIEIFKSNLLDSFEPGNFSVEIHAFIIESDLFGDEDLEEIRRHLAEDVGDMPELLGDEKFMKVLERYEVIQRAGLPLDAGYEHALRLITRHI